MAEDGSAPRRVEVHPQVLHETIDGEVIVIDLTTGTYFSLRDSAAHVWDVVHRSPGVASQDVASALAAYYDESATAIASAVGSFLDQLETEGLVRAVDGAAEQPSLGIAASNGSPPAPFSAPRLEKYTDMQDLVLLDPVHEVDATGWPHTRDGASDPAS